MHNTSSPIDVPLPRAGVCFMSNPEAASVFPASSFQINLEARTGSGTPFSSYSLAASSVTPSRDATSDSTTP